MVDIKKTMERIKKICAEYKITEITFGTYYDCGNDEWDNNVWEVINENNEDIACTSAFEADDRLQGLLMMLPITYYGATCMYLPKTDEWFKVGEAWIPEPEYESTTYDKPIPYKLVGEEFEKIKDDNKTA